MFKSTSLDNQSYTKSVSANFKGCQNAVRSKIANFKGLKNNGIHSKCDLFGKTNWLERKSVFEHEDTKTLMNKNSYNPCNSLSFTNSSGSLIVTDAHDGLAQPTLSPASALSFCEPLQYLAHYVCYSFLPFIML